MKWLRPRAVELFNDPQPGDFRFTEDSRGGMLLEVRGSKGEVFEMNLVKRSPHAQDLRDKKGIPTPCKGLADIE